MSLFCSSTPFKIKKSNCGQIRGKVSQQLIDFTSGRSSNLRSSSAKYLCSFNRLYAPNNNEESKRRNMLAIHLFVHSHG